MKLYSPIRTWHVVCLVCAIATGCFTQEPDTVRQGAILAGGEEFSGLVRRGDFEKAFSGFDATTTRVMPPKKWRST